MFSTIVFSTSGIILTSVTAIPQLRFNQLLRNAIFLSCVLPDKISFQLLKLLHLLSFFPHTLLIIHEL